MDIFADFRSRVAALLSARIAAGTLPDGLDLARFTIEPPRDAAHGDLAINAAMVYAREAKAHYKSPRQFAVALAADLAGDPDVATAEVAGPGFINVALKPEVFGRILSAALRAGPDYGRGAEAGLAPVNVEYVSANPTGPMHVGHARGAVFGDALASLLTFAGHPTTREYYINDAGAQVDVLARSAYLRYREALGETIVIPEGLYPGDYLKPVGAALAAAHGRALLDRDEGAWLPIVREVAIAAMMAMIRDDLGALAIVHDVFSSERALTMRAGGADGNAVDRAIEDLRAKGLVYQGHLAPPKGQAIEDWEDREQTLFRSTAFGDDVDRPLLEVGRRLHLFRRRHRLSQDQDRPWFLLHDRRARCRSRRLCEADAGGGRGAVRSHGDARREVVPARAADAGRRADQNVQTGRGLRDVT